jgi:hypothetical protein
MHVFSTFEHCILGSAHESSQRTVFGFCECSQFLILERNFFLDLRVDFDCTRSFVNGPGHVSDATSNARFFCIQSERILKCRLLRLLENILLNVRKRSLHIKRQAQKADKEQADQYKIGRCDAVGGLILIARARQKTIGVGQDDDVNHHDGNPETANGKEGPPPKPLQTKLDKSPEGKFGNLGKLLFRVLKHGHLFCLLHKLGVECNVLSHLTAQEKETD